MKRLWKDVGFSRKLTCWYQQGKVCYDKRGAVSAANLRFKRDKVSLRGYWCPYCNFWHLTSRIENTWEDEQDFRKQLNRKFMAEEIKEEGVETPETPAEPVTVTDLPADGKPVETPAV